MAETNIIDIPKLLLEELKCCVCNSYLSCSPIRVLPNGKNVCGHCTVFNNEPSLYRALILEKILKGVLFPCRFREQGCVETISFDKSINHEAKCLHKIFQCPYSFGNTCDWKGTMAQIFNHFTLSHSKLIMENAEFKVTMDEDISDLLLIPRGEIIFIMKYEFNRLSKILNYNIQYCSINSYEAFHKFKLISNLDEECSVGLSKKRCIRFDDSFYEMQYPFSLNINKFLESLDVPNCVRIKTDVEAAQGSINSHVIQNLRCNKCFEYLIPPIFELNNEPVCADCSKIESNALPCTNAELQKAVADAYYPCRWRECSFIGRSFHVKKHELECMGRYYNCLFKGCNITFKLSSAINHYSLHNTNYTPSKIIYKTNFCNEYKFSHAFTIIKSSIISVEHSMIMLEQKTHCVTFYSSNPEKFRGTLDFEHKHCKLKSKTFHIKIGEEFKILHNELPRCFKADDDLTVQIEFNDYD